MNAHLENAIGAALGAVFLALPFAIWLLRG